MLDFDDVRNKKTTFMRLVQELSIDDLRVFTNEMIDTQLALIADCVDADVTFVPQDPEADDPYAATPEEVNIAWTLGHVIVHVTASSEESAFLAAEMARGIPYDGRRSRYEVYWQTVKTIETCRQRLEESRRMRLASLDLWPVDPHLDNYYESSAGRGYNALGRFVYGLFHDDDHLGQIADIVSQAKADRSG